MKALEISGIAAFSQKSSAENIPKVALSRCLKLREMFKEGTYVTSLPFQEILPV